MSSISIKGNNVTYGPILRQDLLQELMFIRRQGLNKVLPIFSFQKETATTTAGCDLFERSESAGQQTAQQSLHTQGVHIFSLIHAKELADLPEHCWRYVNKTPILRLLTRGRQCQTRQRARDAKTKISLLAMISLYGKCKYRTLSY
jgi:hypothetical protein